MRLFDLFRRGPKRDWTLAGEHEWRVSQVFGRFHEETLYDLWVDRLTGLEEWHPAIRYGFRHRYTPKRVINTDLGTVIDTRTPL